jgi:anti-sigma factor RsiW
MTTMKKKIVDADILRYIYKETTAEENAAIEAHLFAEGQDAEEFYNFIDLKQQLDTLPESYSPSKKSLDKIFAFSRSLRKASINNED